MQTKNVAEQMTLSDVGISCGRMSPVPCPQTTAMTSKPSSKKSQKSSKKMPIFLDLRKADGRTVEPSFSTMEASLGGFTMPNTTAYHKDANAYVYLPTSMDSLHQDFCLELNISEYPREAMPTKLSEILEEEANPRYNLSQRACQGILNRASRRGKQLPEILKQALEKQATESNPVLPNA